MGQLRLEHPDTEGTIPPRGRPSSSSCHDDDDEGWALSCCLCCLPRSRPRRAEPTGLRSGLPRQPRCSQRRQPLHRRGAVDSRCGGGVPSEAELSLAADVVGKAPPPGGRRRDRQARELPGDQRNPGRASFRLLLRCPSRAQEAQVPARLLMGSARGTEKGRVCDPERGPPADEGAFTPIRLRR